MTKHGTARAASGCGEARYWSSSRKLHDGRQVLLS